MIRFEHYQFTKAKDIIQNIYEQSFPLSERFDFSILKKCDKESNVHLSGIFLTENVPITQESNVTTTVDTPVGMQFTIELPNDITYLMYFAIEEAYRNHNIGSKALQRLITSKDKVMLIIERPVNELTERRKGFYLRNGFYSTNIFFEDTGVQYEVLTSDKNYKPTEQDLLNRYRCMTNNKLTWKRIKGTFNAENIKLIE